MSWYAALVLVLAGSLLAAPGRLQDSSVEERFLAVDVFVDSGAAPLAAWQVELVDVSGHARVVGVEGGEHPAFLEAPYYDPAALQSGRIIVAALHVGADLPVGRTRVARVHLVTDAEPSLAVVPMAAATVGGESIDVRAELER